MTGREAARYLRVSHRMVLQWAKEGRIPAHRLSGTARATGATARERHGSVYNSLKHWGGRRECGEFPPQALVVLLGRGQPHSVVRLPLAPVAEDKDNLVLNVDREAAKHGASLGRHRSHRVEHELMRDRLSLLDGEEGARQREGGSIATGLRHGRSATKILPQTWGQLRSRPSRPIP